MSFGPEDKRRTIAMPGQSARDIFFTPIGWAQSARNQADKTAFALEHQPSGQWAVCQTTESEGELIVQSGDDVYIIYVARGENAAEVCMRIKMHYLLQNKVSPNTLTLYKDDSTNKFPEQPLPITLIDSILLEDDLPEDRFKFDKLEYYRFDRRSFLPSYQLAQIWKNGLVEYSKKHQAGEKVRSELNSDSPEDISNQFSLKLTKMFGTLGSITQRGEADYTLIAHGNAFLLEVQHEIFNRFYIPPAQHSRFLYMLLIELRHFLTCGGVIEGRWGCLLIDGHDIKIQVKEFVSRATGRANAKVIK